MASLLHEVWVETDATGGELPSCVLAGPQGDDARRMMSPNARLLTTFTAGSHFEAMTLYYRLRGWGEYQTIYPQDHESYPEDWQR